jgi:hypothetical protein
MLNIIPRVEGIKMKTKLRPVWPAIYGADSPEAANTVEYYLSYQDIRI